MSKRCRDTDVGIVAGIDGDGAYAGIAYGIIPVILDQGPAFNGDVGIVTQINDPAG
jgi:hypothetical protein